VSERCEAVLLHVAPKTGINIAVVNRVGGGVVPTAIFGGEGEVVAYLVAESHLGNKINGLGRASGKAGINVDEASYVPSNGVHGKNLRLV